MKPQLRFQPQALYESRPTPSMFTQFMKTKFLPKRQEISKHSKILSLDDNKQFSDKQLAVSSMLEKNAKLFENHRSPKVNLTSMSPEKRTSIMRKTEEQSVEERRSY
jgi:hypothetical protein